MRITPRDCAPAAPARARRVRCGLRVLPRVLYDLSPGLAGQRQVFHLGVVYLSPGAIDTRAGRDCPRPCDSKANGSFASRPPSVEQPRCTAHLHVSRRSRRNEAFNASV